MNAERPTTESKGRLGASRTPQPRYALVSIDGGFLLCVYDKLGICKGTGTIFAGLLLLIFCPCVTLQTLLHMAWLLFSLSPRNMENAWSGWARVAEVQTDGCAVVAVVLSWVVVCARVCVVRYVRWKVLTAVLFSPFFLLNSGRGVEQHERWKI